MTGGRWSVAFGAVGEGVFFDMEADFGLGRRRRRFQERTEFLVDVTQGAIVQEQGFINLRQALEDGGVGGEVLAHFDKGADDVQAHGNSAGAVENGGGQEVAAGTGSGAVPRPKGQGTEGRINAQNGSQGDSATEHREVMDALREIRDALAAVRRSAGQEEPINRKEAQRIFAVLAKLRTEAGARKAPLHTVFEYLVLQGLSGERTARKCRCAPSLISARVKTLQERFGLSVRQLQNYASALVEMETTVKGDRRHRRASGPPDDFDRPGGPQDDADRQEGGEEDHFRDGEG